MVRSTRLFSILPRLRPLPGFLVFHVGTLEVWAFLQSILAFNLFDIPFDMFTPMNSVSAER